MATANDMARPTTSSGAAKPRVFRGRVLVILTEIGLVLAAVAVFFAFLTILTDVYFPQGTDLIADRADSVAASQSGRVDIAISDDTSQSTELFVGEILRIQRRVQRRGADSLNWSVANVGDTFARHDAVQTFARSTALLKVDDKSRLTIGQNSLIVFDNQEVDPFTSRQAKVLIMVDGELSGRLSSDAEGSIQFGVNLPNSDLTLTSTSSADDVDFLITVNEDQSTTVNLHSGAAVIIGQDGSRKTIGENESITIDSSGTEYSVSTLPLAPRSTGPVNRKSITYRNVPKPVEFTWSAIAKADRYHIVVARDADFSDRVVDDDVIGTSFSHGALGPGEYYWYVRSRAAWAQSQQSPTRRLTVIQDTSAPFLELESPPAQVAAGEWRLRGRTENTATIFVDDSRVENQNGRIDHLIDLKHGANIIVVRAMDDVGNLNYESLSVNAK